MDVPTLIATIASGLFAGASLYVSVVQHPSWLACGPEAAIREFGPSTRRAAPLQGLLAVVTLIASGAAFGRGAGTGWLAGGILIGTIIPFTLLVIQPVNRRLLDSGLDLLSDGARALFVRWGRLHAVRTLVGVAVFALFVVLSARAGAGS